MDQLRVWVRLRGEQQQRRARDHHKPGCPAQDSKQLAGVIQGVAEVARHADMAHTHLLYKVAEQQRRGHDQQRHENIEKALLVQPVLVKGELNLKPAEEHAEGARAGRITGDLQRFFIHKPNLDSIKYYVPQLREL